MSNPNFPLDVKGKFHQLLINIQRLSIEGDVLRLVYTTPHALFTKQIANALWE